VPGGGGCTP
jgi:hypothetical protein